MRILLLGGTGLIGRRLTTVLAQAGHELVLGLRNSSRNSSRRTVPPEAAGVIEVDFDTDHAVADWLPRLVGIEVVINAVGIIAERGDQRFDAIHVKAPTALFAACARSGVRHVVQISAVGADAQAASSYHRSKRAADEALQRLDIVSTIVQPSLVFAPDGASTRMFALLAALPLVPLPGRGGQCVQPIHLDDLCDAVAACLAQPEPPRRLLAVGAEPLTFRDYLLQLRLLMGLGKGLMAPVPIWLVRAASTLAGRFTNGAPDPEALGMLERGACGDAADVADVLGRTPRAVADFAKPEVATAMGVAARLAWLLPLLRISLAVMWLVTGVVSLGIYPVEASLQLLARTGLHGGLALVALYSAAAFDIAMGVALLAGRRRVWLYRLQIALILGYTAIISVFLPEFWLHPYGPVLKNIPLLALILALHEMERSPWNT